MDEKKHNRHYNRHISSDRPKKIYDDSPKHRNVEQPEDLSQEEANMNFDFALFTETQIAELLENGKAENARKNHVPIAYIEIKKLGYSILATEIDFNFPDNGFGLCDYNGELKFSSFSIAKLEEDLKGEHPLLSKNLDFLGKYPIAVYAKVAREIGTLVVEDNDPMLKSVFEKYSTDLFSNRSASIEKLNP